VATFGFYFSTELAAKMSYTICVQPEYVFFKSLRLDLKTLKQLTIYSNNMANSPIRTTSSSSSSRDGTGSTSYSDRDDNTSHTTSGSNTIYSTTCICSGNSWRIGLDICSCISRIDCKQITISTSNFVIEPKRPIKTRSAATQRSSASATHFHSRRLNLSFKAVASEAIWQEGPMTIAGRRSTGSWAEGCITKTQCINIIKKCHKNAKINFIKAQEKDIRKRMVWNKYERSTC